MSRLSSFLDNLKIRQKLFLLYAGAFLLPMAAIAAFLIGWLYRALFGWETRGAQAAFQKIEASLDEMFSGLLDLSDRIYASVPIRKIIGKKFSGTLEVYNAYKDLEFVNDFLIMYDSAMSIRFYTSNQTLRDNSFITRETPDVVKSAWHQEAMRERGHPFLVFKRDSVTGRMTLSLVRSVWNFSDQSFVGVMSINIKPDFVDSLFRSGLFDTVVECAGEIVFSSNNFFDEGAERAMAAGARRKGTTASASIEAFKFDGEKIGLARREFHPPKMGGGRLDIFYFIPRALLFGSTSRVTKITVAALAFCAAMSVASIFFFSSVFDSRVKKVRAGIESVSASEFDIPPSIGGRDEFAEIYSALREMAARINNLINQVYARDIEKQRLLARQNDIRFKMLAAQINPHFLFNTLEHIRMRAIDLGDKDVPYMLKTLAKILRYNLSVKSAPVPLLKEIEIVGDYLEIQHKRFSKRVSYDIMLMCDIKRAMILPLLIQPLVENVFKHGLESRLKDGFVYIEVRSEERDGGRDLLVTVRDNGHGFPAQKLKALRESFKDPTAQAGGESIGLANVSARIKLFYGAEYGLDIDSEEGRGAAVTIRAPFVEGDAGGETLC